MNEERALIRGLAVADQRARLLHGQILDDQIRQQAQAAPRRLSAPKTSPVGAPPSPSGLSIASSVDAIRISWSEVSVPGLFYYEVQWSTSSSMVNPTSERRTETSFTLNELGSGARYFRVRSVARTGISEWSPVLDAETGLITSESLAIGAATNPISVTFLPPFGTPVFDSNTGPLTGVIVQFEFKVEDCILSPAVTVVSDFLSSGGAGTFDPGLTILVLNQLLIDTVEVDRSENDVFSVGQGKVTAGGLGQDVSLDEGLHQLQVYMELIPEAGTPNYLQVTPLQVKLGLTEFRR